MPFPLKESKKIPIKKRMQRPGKKSRINNLFFASSGSLQKIIKGENVLDNSQDLIPMIRTGYHF